MSTVKVKNKTGNTDEVFTVSEEYFENYKDHLTKVANRRATKSTDESE
ncbi:hypothetical protein [Vibrio fortis]|nr:hypothetical protein [Vibrio fortis]